MHDWARDSVHDRVCDFLKTSYSMKTRNVDVSYQTFFFPSHFIYSTGKAFLECTVIKFVNKFDEKSTTSVRKGKSTSKMPFKYFFELHNYEYI